jgi:tRNA G46 methylase TrmB
MYFKTDHKEYFDSTKEIIESQWLWKIANWTHNYENSEIFDMDNITEFEGFYRGEKTDINYLELEK